MNNTSDNLVLCAVYPDAPTASLAIGLLAANAIQASAHPDAARAALRAGGMLQ